jgi:hypothetical protein
MILAIIQLRRSISMKKLIIISGLLLFLVLSCSTKEYCYECTAIDSVFETHYPDSVNKLKLLRIDTISHKECFDGKIPTDSLIELPYWEGINHQIIFHKRTFNCK